jgi:hypothetical protein
MQVEPIVGIDGTSGWTVSWKGRGWHESFDRYLAFFDESLAIGKATEMLVVPSVKYHLPGSDSEEWRIDEYVFTTSELFKVWRRHYPDEPMPIEKDFSPTLAGDDRSQQKETIIDWIRTVPGLIRSAQAGVTVGLKIFNAMFDDDFQLEILRTAIDPGEQYQRADFLVYANRLFDPAREFDGKRGIAYGGPDLSERNLRILNRLRECERRGELRNPVQPISATGDIDSGQKAVEYERLGCTSFQMHTLFQLPHSCFAKRNGTRIEKALHHLLFHPESGYIAWKMHFREQ